MTPRFRFAPVSSAPSPFIDVAAGYFIISGVLNFALVAFVLLGVARGTERISSISALSVAVVVVAGAGMIWTGVLIGRRARLGARLAWIFVLLPLVAMLVGARPIDALELVWAALSIGILVAIRRDLS